MRTAMIAVMIFSLSMMGWLEQDDLHPASQHHREAAIRLPGI